jgi:hypothetical protein
MSNSRRINSRASVDLVALVFGSLSTDMVLPSAAGATQSHSSIACSTTVSNPHPSQYSTVVVIVRARSHAGVTTTAHYRTTNTVHGTTANSVGVASLAYRISRAVVARRGALRGVCSTSFTPIS